MARSPIWKSIAAELESEIARGLYRAGDKLPTEAELSSRFGVNRHTARRALRRWSWGASSSLTGGGSRSRSVRSASACMVRGRSSLARMPRK